MHVIKTLSILSGCIVLLAACSSTPTAKMASSSMPTPVVPTAPVKSAASVESKVQSVVIPAYLDPKSALSTNRSIYFDFDNFSIKPEFSQTLELHGKYLAANPKLSIHIEGNADERGSAEYNLALGQKRAETVLRALKVYGVKDTQMEAVSWGEEKPKAAGHNEAAFSQNRRADLVYPTK